MAAAKGSEGDLMRVAIYCLEWARQAIAIRRRSPPDANPDADLNQFERDEYYILKLGHVYESCRILNKSWPSVFPSSARSAANTFVQRWTGKGANQQQLCRACRFNDYQIWEEQESCSQCKQAEPTCGTCREHVCEAHAYYKRFGKDLRDAYAHYEEAMADPSHRRRGAPSGYKTVRGIQAPGWSRGPYWDRDSLWLLNKEYRLDGVHDALVELEVEFSAVLTQPDDRWKLRKEA